MKKILTTLIALFALSIQASEFPQGSPTFFTSAPAVMQAAKNNGKPVILIFSASWCGPCQAMKNEVYPSSEVRPLQDKFNWAYLDIDNEANSQLADGFRVGSIPYIVFVNAEGTTVLNVQQGGSPPKEFAKELTRVLQRAERAKTAG